MKNAPCYKCQDKADRCHSTCEWYKSYRKVIDEINRTRHEETELMQPTARKKWAR